MTRRRLTENEIALWKKVIETAKPLHSHPDAETPAPAAPSAPVAKPTVRRPVEMSPKPAVQAQPPHRPPIQMDSKAFGRMKRGKLEPEGKIDLHGMTLNQAHPALTRFILDSQSQGRRLVLVITGKGKSARDDGPIPVPKGIIRRQAQFWLNAPPLDRAVLQVAPAHIRHGGDGAFYVYLRKRG